MKKLFLSLFLLSFLSGCTASLPKFDLFGFIKENIVQRTVLKPEPYKPLYDLDIALDYLGYTERDNRKELNEFLRVDPVRVPWCAAFVGAVLRASNIPTTDSFLARSYLKWGVEVEEPLYGDLLIFERGTEDWQGHVGFYLGKLTQNGKLYYMVLGGNQSNMVSIQYYSTAKLIGIRRYGSDLPANIIGSSPEI